MLLMQNQVQMRNNSVKMQNKVGFPQLLLRLSFCQSEVLVSFKIKKGGRVSPTVDNDILFSLFYWEIELFPGIFQSSQIMEICVAHCF